MNSDKIKGAMDDAAGRAKRQVGEWTGNTETQADGAAQQVKGKAEKIVGSLRDALHKGSDTKPDSDTRHDVETERDMDDASGSETVLERETIRERK